MSAPYLRNFVLALAMLACGVRAAHAVWPNDPTVNVPLCTAPQDQLNGDIVQDGAGGAIVTWMDHRNGLDYDIFARRVDANGNPLWAPDGEPVCTQPGDQILPAMIPDGTGGAFIAWSDHRNPTDYDIFAQHLLASGAVDPTWPPSGVPVCTATGDQRSVAMVGDGLGGAILAWIDYRGNVDYRPDIYAQHLDPSGITTWAPNGVPVCVWPFPQELTLASHHCMIADGAGGAIICWADQRAGNRDIFAERIDATGAPLWTPNGVAVCTAPGDQTFPELATDNANGAIITWTDGRVPATAIYAQRVNAGGAPLWVPNGVQVAPIAANQATPGVCSDGGNGAIMAWEDHRNADADIYAQHLDGFGLQQWGASGVPVCTAVLDQTDVIYDVMADGLGGAFVAWTDIRGGATNADVYVQRMFASGSPAWTPNGVAVSTAAQPQTGQQLTSDGLGGVILAWNDQRNASTATDIYVQRVNAGGALAGVANGTPPGTPLAGAGFVSTLRENFVYPPNHAALGGEAPITLGLPTFVQTGFVVALDDSNGPVTDPSRWSDVLVFPLSGPSSGPRAMLVSDPVERPFTDADFAAYGFSTADVVNGNTVYLRERVPFTHYTAADTATGAVGDYRVYSDWDTLPPGTPLSGPSFQVSLRELPEGQGEITSVSLPTMVQPGFVVLLEDSTQFTSPEDTTKWSDVVYFQQDPAGGPAMAWLISDGDSVVGAPSHKGMSSADFTQFGFTVLDVLESNTVYLREKAPPDVYIAQGPIAGSSSGQYDIFSDVDDSAVLPGHALQFALRGVAPNPAPGRARVAFSLARDAAVRLEIYDGQGRRVRTLASGRMTAGAQSREWDGRDDAGHAVAAGNYFVRLTSDGASMSRRVTLMR